MLKIVCCFTGFVGTIFQRVFNNEMENYYLEEKST